MQFDKIKKVHKKIQKEKVKNTSLDEKIVIRHWNVFYNQVRGRDLSKIEKFARKPLLGDFLLLFGELFQTDVKLYQVSYSDNKNIPHCTLYSAKDLIDFIRSEAHNE
jgi:hypothetical protein